MNKKEMRKTRPYKLILLAMTVQVLCITGCEKFFDPEPTEVVLEEQMYKDWYDFRSAGMGLYSLMQGLVEQIVILGELRADMLQVTENADRDLIEIFEFNVTSSNRYVSPVLFYRLITGCNNLINMIESFNPDVLDPEAPISNYDKLYGEILCMRAWAYFNAARIYGTIPYLHTKITTIEDMRNYLNQEKVIIRDYVKYSEDGVLYNDTIYNDTVYLEKIYLDERSLIDTFTNELVEKVKVQSGTLMAVGANYSLDNNDLSWDVSVWNSYAYHTLLAEMYFHIGDLTRARSHFEVIMFDNSEITGNVRYGVDSRFRNSNWWNMFASIDRYEHILVLDFNKGDQQQNGLQALFSHFPGSHFQLKPSGYGVHVFESVWRDFQVPQDIKNDRVIHHGEPGDINRGPNISFAYFDGLVQMDLEEWHYVLDLKRIGRFTEVENIMEPYDTVVYKYTRGKGNFSHDCDFTVYRAGGVHLHYAELMNRIIRNPDIGEGRNTVTAWQVLGDGTYGHRDECLGIRGRIGLEKWEPDQKIYTFNPYTNEIINAVPVGADYKMVIRDVEDWIIEEKARETAWEGERFYDLARVARRRDDNSYLADRVASKFSGAEAERIRTLLMDEKNWYLPFFELPIISE